MAPPKRTRAEGARLGSQIHSAKAQARLEADRDRVLAWLADGPCQAGELTRRLGCHPTRFRSVTRPLIDAGLIVRARYFYRLPDQRVEPRAPAGWNVVAVALAERPHDAHELAKMTGRTLKVMRVWLYRAEQAGRLERVGKTWILANNGEQQ